jgi:hypothetical protein
MARQAKGGLDDPTHPYWTAPRNVWLAAAVKRRRKAAEAVEAKDVEIRGGQ